MAKITEASRKDFAKSIEPYQEKIDVILQNEKSALKNIGAGSGVPYKKLELAEDMIYASSLYVAQNSLSMKILEVKNNDVLNEARKILYKAIIYLEELVTNIIDVSYAELKENYEAIADFPVEKRFHIIKKLGLIISLIEEAFSDNSKWKWSFVELKGRYAVVAKNLIDMRSAAKSYFNPNDENYEITVMYVRMLVKLLEGSASGYRDKYELSTRRIDDMRNGIRFLLARQKLALAINDSKTAEDVKKKAIVWKDKMNADQKSGSSK